ncbi:MAG: glutamine--fructose-6-phosphate transaminase (isomerizing) [Candidatus Levybacteria bacterium RIFCSPHIGHO2_02_FULL_37_13]|nr:MAG: glutamine--fructose-6-phosphate transaminase (isomerizing) [Candidatus Levybacteria bacterium RIFCSPHIGHO2_02_FULL_37_13]OGH29395.1 MAG: glutamine--fructose-6-phosphate transaminase (isomerizing) [Candidatus Levybacteria bacterium RIFCSPHIGHO2_12_FULL_37_9]OGH39474.1 MAG: glutamine--fructose-6-phosphate transaminase (isomerizing) [Candidatus Levybacteria bacterium RIFCSPLOWO2_01_FULL_37_26]
MCGIFGYIGNKDASKVIHEGLRRLEYRGYDSWGIAVLSSEIKMAKKVGAIGDLENANLLPKAKIGIGHTRWATHGGITQNNAHPHLSSNSKFALAQNGIVENFEELKETLLKKKYKFQTETDTEVIVRLIEQQIKLKKKLKDAIRAVFGIIKGRNTIIVLTDNNKLIAARNGSPLVIGVSKTSNEIFFSSDTLSFAPYADQVLVVDNGQMVVSDGSKLSLFDIKTGKSLPYSLEKINFKTTRVNKEGYDHFMLKEIHESSYVINQVANQDLKQYEDFSKVIKKAKNIYTIGSGTAGIAASQIAFYLRVFGKVKAISVIGADIYEYYDLLQKGDLMIVPSQSGETADVLEVLEIAKKKGVKIASYVNMQGSTMSRMSDYKFLSHAGPEICVMSTKVFTSQIAWGYLISKIVAGKASEGINNLKILAESIDKYLNAQSNHDILKRIAGGLSRSKDIFLLGKYQNFNIVKEGMVKIIEGSYKHAHGIPAGDLKHYAITLMEKGVPVIVVVSEDVAYDDVLNVVNQVKARGAEVIGISPRSHLGFSQFIPVLDIGETSAIINVIPLQLLAYYMAVELGNNVDKPRNIAKSVTVK